MTMKEQERRQRQIRVGIALDSTIDLVETTQQLQEMSSVEKVELYVEPSFPAATSTEFNQFMQAVGRLPKMSSLRIRSATTFRGGDFVQLPFEALQVALEAATSHSCLKYLHLSHVDFVVAQQQEREGSGSTTCCPVQALARLLQDNTTLQELRFDFGGCRKISRKTQLALIQMLQLHNFTLQVLDFDAKTSRQITPSKRKQLDFYLALNQTGVRQKLLHPTVTAKSEEWEDAVISNRGQSSTVYYLLSNNPTILCA